MDNKESKMDKFDQLFIRACKSGYVDTYKRMQTLARRFYGVKYNEKEIHAWIVAIGAEIVDKYCPISLNRFLCGSGTTALYEIQFNPDKFKDWSDSQKHQYILAHMIVVRLMLMSGDDLKKHGYKSSAYFRNKFGKEC